MTYQIIYSPASLDDLRSIYSYIAFEKFAPENAENQVNRIRKSIRSLDLYVVNDSAGSPALSISRIKAPLGNTRATPTIGSSPCV